MKQLLEIWLLIMSVFGLVLFGIDKYKAARNRWRIEEKALIMCALLGGGMGCFLGMHIFHHKTKKKPFPVLVPLCAIVQACLLLFLLPGSL